MIIDNHYKDKKIKRFDTMSEKRLKWIDRNRYYYEKQKRHFRFLVPEGLSVLDLGCGTGHLLNALKPKRGVGIDIAPKILKIARRKYPDLDFQFADIEELESWGEKFDVIIMADVIGHLQDIEKAFRKLRSFCIADTRLIISYYNFIWEPILKLGEFIGLKMPQQYQNWLSSEDICNLLSLARFQVVKSEYRLLIPKWIPFVSNFINRFIGSLPGIRRFCLCQYLVVRPLGMREEKDLSSTILIPCKNEKGNVEEAIKRIPKFGSHQEILFVEGHSMDGTREEIERIIKAYPTKNIKLLIQDGKGKGNAVRRGFEAAKGDILIILDADLTMPPEDLPKFYRAILEDHGEFINGCRLIYPMEKDAMRLLNILGNKFFSTVFTWLLNQRIKDTLCGTKVLSKASYKQIAANRAYFGNFDPFGDFDLLFGASKLNLKIVEMPVRYCTRTYGESQITRFRHGWLLLKMCFFAMRKLKD